MRSFFFLMLLPIFCFASGIGTVIGVFGTVSAVRNGAESALARGTSLFENDKIVTLANSYVKFRLTDGSLISLTPESEYTIQNYTYNPSSSDNNCASHLAKGGLRCMSGQIAKTNPDDYSFSTPTATMGVRGTIFTILIKCALNKDNCITYFGCDSGSISITNSSGEVTIGPGLQYRYAEYSSDSAPPVLRSTQPAELNPNVFQTPQSNQC